MKHCFDSDDWSDLEEMARRIRAIAAQNSAPGMTDLMVTPESIGPYLDANPPPPAEDAQAKHDPGCYYLRSSDHDGDEAARCDCRLSVPPAPTGEVTRRNAPVMCACHDDGPAMSDGRCATCLLPCPRPRSPWCRCGHGFHEHREGEARSCERCACPRYSAAPTGRGECAACGGSGKADCRCGFPGCQRSVPCPACGGTGVEGER